MPSKEQIGIRSLLGAARLQMPTSTYVNGKKAQLTATRFRRNHACKGAGKREIHVSQKGSVKAKLNLPHTKFGNSS